MMGIRNLEEFLNEKKQSEETQLNWEQKRTEWLQAVELFYAQIQVLLKPLKEKGLLSIEFKKTDVREEYIGEYETQQMTILFADQKVTFSPIGTNIIAAFGRIDMHGPDGEVKFLWVDKESEGPKITVTVSDGSTQKKEPQVKQPVPPEDRAWKIATPPPHIRFIELNEDSFSDVLLGVIHG